MTVGGTSLTPGTVVEADIRAESDTSEFTTGTAYDANFASQAGDSVYFVEKGGSSTFRVRRLEPDGSVVTFGPPGRFAVHTRGRSARA